MYLPRFLALYFRGHLPVYIKAQTIKLPLKRTEKHYLVPCRKVNLFAFFL